MTGQKPVLFSGIQPSGLLNIGHYLGALRNWVHLQHEYDCLFCIVDLHAITVRQDPALLRERSLTLAAQYIAVGIDPNEVVLFLQSHVTAHAEMAWLLSCNTYMGELSRMTQFKDKSAGKAEKNIGVGLFTYPSLMAADILLYQTQLVPVGADQKQHLELTRDIAGRMNHYYGDLLTVPEPYIPEVGARIMSLQEPTKKMSKSDPNTNNYILLLDEPDTIRRKVRKAVMDSIQGITYDVETRPGVANLLTIYAAISGEKPDEVATRYAEQGNAALKNDVAEAVIETLRPVQQQYADLMADQSYVQSILQRGADTARERSASTLRATYEAMGFLAW